MKLRDQVHSYLSYPFCREYPHVEEADQGCSKSMHAASYEKGTGIHVQIANSLDLRQYHLVCGL